MNRRGFIGSILALGAAPAIVKAANLMPVTHKLIVPPPQLVVSGESTLEFYEGSTWSRTSPMMARLWAIKLHEEALRNITFNRLMA